MYNTDGICTCVHTSCSNQLIQIRHIVSFPPCEHAACCTSKLWRFVTARQRMACRSSAQTNPACADCAVDARFARAAEGAGHGGGPAAGQGPDPGHQGQPGVAGHQVRSAALPFWRLPFPDAVQRELWFLLRCREPHTAEGSEELCGLAPCCEQSAGSCATAPERQALEGAYRPGCSHLGSFFDQSLAVGGAGTRQRRRRRKRCC